VVADFLRISFLALGALILTAAVIWYLQFCYQEIRGSSVIVIDPLTVVDQEGKGNEELGKALALMLQARLESLTNELREAQEGLTASATTATVQAAAGVTRVGDVRLWTQDVALHTGLLQPVDMKLSVGGVEVGGMLPWLQRRMSRDRTLHFTLYTRDGEAQVFGSLTPLQLNGSALRLSLPGTDGKAPALDTIVDSLAHEIVRRMLAQDSSNRLESLNAGEFRTLASVLVSAAESNRKSLQGRPAQKEFADLVPQVATLADDVPQWAELGYLTAWVADKARDSATAVRYYSRTVANLDGGKQQELIAFINQRIGTLEGSTEAVAAVAVTGTPAAPAGAPGGVAIATALDYSGDIKHVRDSGDEGSVVGQALATVLEFQIHKALNEDHQISARYLYYVARKAMGTANTDSGATLSDAVAALKNDGAVEDSAWPYVPGQFAEHPPAALESARHFHITSVRAVKGLADLKHALQQNGPTVVGISLFSSAMTAAVAKSGAIPMPGAKEQLVGGHAVVVVGYDDERQVVKFVNSWGNGWGQRGFGSLPYKYLDKYMSDAWTFQLAKAGSTVASSARKRREG
jgi:hypothetical protein